jgi:hypothetical protein
MFKLELPAFPIRCTTKEGQSFKARFKRALESHKIVLYLTNKSDTRRLVLPAPKEQVLSWGAFANQYFTKAFSPENSKEAPTNETANLPVSGFISTSKISPEPSDNNKVLSKLRGIVLTKHALPNELYTTAQSKDPKKSYMCRYEGLSTDGLRYILQVYFPALREWSRVEVDGDYKLILRSSEENPMPKKSTKESKAKPSSKPTESKPSKPVNDPQATTKKGLTVYEAWGQAFATLGTKPGAPKLIVGFMEKHFPGRKTNWAKWVNSVRNVYNAGKLPGVAAPAERLKPYK